MLGVFTPGTPLYNEEGGEILKGPRNLDAAKLARRKRLSSRLCRWSTRANLTRSCRRGSIRLGAGKFDHLGHFSISGAGESEIQRTFGRR